ncbi:MAG: hypothetical protein V1685_04515 [Parcubacteria group bacterium]
MNTPKTTPKRRSFQLLSSHVLRSMRTALEDDFDTNYPYLVERPARLEFPLGELTNPAIAGYVWAWQLRRKIQTASITGKEGFLAQGLEGKVCVHTNMVTALLAYGWLPEYRRAVYGGAS